MSLDAAQVEAAGVAITAFGAWTSLVGWVWSIRSIAVNARDDLADLKAERERDKLSWGERLAKAEATANAVQGLADAVRHGAEMTSAKIEYLAERFSEHASETKAQLAEVKDEQRNVRLALARRQSNTRKAN